MVAKGTEEDMKIYKIQKFLKLQVVVKIAFVNKENHSQTSVQRVEGLMQVHRLTTNLPGTQ